MTVLKQKKLSPNLDKGRNKTCRLILSLLFFHGKARIAYKETECVGFFGLWVSGKISLKRWQWYSEAAVKEKSSTPYQEGKADYDRGAAAQSISSYLSALLTIQEHPELDGRTLDIVHCFYKITRHFLRWKVAFSALIKSHILHVHHFLLHVHVHMHVLFSVAPLFATRACARARVVFSGTTFCYTCMCTCTCCFQWHHFSLHVHVQVHMHVLFSPVALSLCWSSDVSTTISDTLSKSSKSSRNPNSNVGLLQAISNS